MDSVIILRIMINATKSIISHKYQQNTNQLKQERVPTLMQKLHFEEAPFSLV